MALAHITGGQYCPLGSAAALSSAIVGGAREEMALEGLMSEVAKIVSDMPAKDCTEEEQVAQVWSKMRASNVKTKQLRLEGAELPQASAQAQIWSSSSSLHEVKKTFSASTPSSAPSSRYSAPSAPASASAYTVAEEEISVAQVSRMLKKNVARSKAM